MEENKCTQCESENLIFVQYEYKNGAKNLRKQCNDCGRLLTLNYKRSFVKNFSELPMVNQNARDENSKEAIRKSIVKKEFYNIRLDSFRNRLKFYSDVYLKSDKWFMKRNLIMDYYNHKCKNCGGNAKDVHHITYDNIFVEKFEELIPLCRNCHELQHHTERKDTPSTMDEINSRIKIINECAHEFIENKIVGLDLNENPIYDYKCIKCRGEMNFKEI